MNVSKPTFKPIDLKKMQSVVDEFSAEKNVPALSFPAVAPVAAVPVPAPARAEEGSAPPAEASEPKPVVKRVRKSSQPAPVRRLAVELPDYLFTAISKKAAEEGTTKRYIVLEALRAHGFVVNDIDFSEDGRRVQ
ncbi:hypothetical protein RLW55_06090 [Hyphomicrobium sp. B1]|uniref:hypothetical protein n=1 Tax=Hyphomicrobium sp. B1 TaxID=3075651 RepID=UPI003C2B87E9